MQSITIPFAIQKENSAQEIITRKIPIKLLMAQKLRSEAEWDLLDSRDIDEIALLIIWLNFNYIIFVLIYTIFCFILIASFYS